MAHNGKSLQQGADLKEAAKLRPYTEPPPYPGMRAPLPYVSSSNMNKYLQAERQIKFHEAPQPSEVSRKAYIPLGEVRGGGLVQQRQQQQQQQQQPAPEAQTVQQQAGVWPPAKEEDWCGTIAGADWVPPPVSEEDLSSLPSSILAKRVIESGARIAAQTQELKGEYPAPENIRSGQ